MYSGGQGYFQALRAKPFQQVGSCFGLQNKNWLLLCLKIVGASLPFSMSASEA
jgi:hypothetical protein